MVAEAGHFALILAAGLALLAALWPHIAIARRDRAGTLLTSQLVAAQFILIAFAFGTLVHGFLISDFSIRLVAANSHTAKPLLYKISGVWGNHEGSLMLWVLILTFFSTLVAFFGQSLPVRFKGRVLGIQSFLTLGFLLFIIFTSNPFERLDPAPLEGNGLNPLLQDPGLAFHPPMLYLGYVGLSVAFSFAVAALIDGTVGPAWARYVRPWTLLAWIFLTGGIALGSWWAYYELGWGGWWFWDPVENASFMPWLAASALLHSAIVVEKRDALKGWTILLALIAFSFSLLGTFLVRSGVLTSVHAFAVDPARGIFILAFLALVVGGSFLLYAWRARQLEGGGLFGLVSRESALVINNIFLSTFAAVVLVGTLYPLILEAATGDQISVGPPFFNFATALLMAPLIVALMAGPFMTWKRTRLTPLKAYLVGPVLIAVMFGIWALWTDIGGSIMTALGLALAAGLIASVIAEISARLRQANSFKAKLKRLTKLPQSSWGMSFAHLGLAIITLGITISEAASHETLAAMAVGEEVTAGPYRYHLQSVEPLVGPNYTALKGVFTVYKNDRVVTRLYPEDRVYGQPLTPTTEAGIHPLWHGDLYAVIGQPVDTLAAGSGAEIKYSVRVYYKPGISGLWFGAILMMIGGLLSLTDRRLRIGIATRSAAVSRSGIQNSGTQNSGHKSYGGATIKARGKAASGSAAE